MNQISRAKLLHEINFQRAQLLEVVNECNSLIHSRVIRKSEEVDKLIAKYYTLESECRAK